MKLTHEVNLLWNALPRKVADLATLGSQKLPKFGLILMKSGAEGRLPSIRRAGQQNNNKKNSKTLQKPSKKAKTFNFSHSHLEAVEVEQRLRRKNVNKI